MLPGSLRSFLPESSVGSILCPEDLIWPDSSSRFSKNSLWLFVRSSFSCCHFSSCFCSAPLLLRQSLRSPYGPCRSSFSFSAVSWLPFSRESRISSLSFERTSISSFRRRRFSFMKLSFCWDADASRRILSSFSEVSASSFFQSSSSFCRVSINVSSSSSSLLDASKFLRDLLCYLPACLLPEDGSPPAPSRSWYNRRGSPPLFSPAVQCSTWLYSAEWIVPEISAGSAATVSRISFLLLRLSSMDCRIS